MRNGNFVFEALKDHPRQVILDTDIGPDCDDAGAIAVLAYYQRLYQFPVVGICNCTSNPAGNGVIDAICRHCDLPVPLQGRFSGKGFMDQMWHRKYNVAVADAFSPDYRNGTLPVLPEVAFYRKLLAAAPDDGVVIITIGMFNDLAALLRSEGDAFSPLSGAELVRQKVHCVVSMATNLPQGRECNIVEDYRSAQYFFAHWQTPVILSDFFIGASVKSGTEYGEQYAEADVNPLAASYYLYTHGQRYHASFDLTAVQFAVLGEGELYGLNEPGKLEFWEELPGLKDSTRFVPDARGNLYYMNKRSSDREIGKILDDILASYKVL